MYNVAGAYCLINTCTAAPLGYFSTQVTTSVLFAGNIFTSQDAAVTAGAAVGGLTLNP